MSEQDRVYRVELTLSDGNTRTWELGDEFDGDEVTVENIQIGAGDKVTPAQKGEHGLKRCCLYCEHHDLNEEKHYPDHEGAVCTEDGVDDIGSLTEPKTPNRCSAFRVEGWIEDGLESKIFEVNQTGDLLDENGAVIDS